MMRKITKGATGRGLLPTPSLSSVPPSSVAAAKRMFTATAIRTFQQQQHQNSNKKLSRIFVMELNKAKSEARMNPDPIHLEKLVQKISETSLASIGGLDGKVVATLLGTLETLSADGASKAVDECVQWVQENRASLSPSITAQICTSLSNLESPRAMETLELLANNVVSACGDNSVPLMPESSAMLLAAYLHEAPHSLAIPALINNLLLSVPDLGTSDITTIVAASLNTGAGGFRTDLRSLIENMTEAFVASHLATAQPPQLITMFCAAAKFTATGTRAAAVGTAQQFKDAIFAKIQEHQAQLTFNELLGCLDATKYSAADSSERISILTAITPLLEKESFSLQQVAGIFYTYTVIGEKLPEEFLAKAQEVLSKSYPSEWSPSIAKKVLASSASYPAALFDDVVLAKAVPVENSQQTFLPTGYWLASRTHRPVFEKRSAYISSLALSHCTTWTPYELVAFLRALSFVQTKESRKLMRDIAPKIIDKVHNAHSVIVCGIANAYGRAKVRHENLCNAIADRCLVMKDILAPHEITLVLSALATVEFRNTRIFLDMIPLIRSHLNKMTASQVTHLICAYAKQSIWHYRFLQVLGDRALFLADHMTLTQAVAIVQCMDKMSIKHERLNRKLISICKQAMEKRTFTVEEAISMLSAFSRTKVWDIEMFEQLADIAIENKQKLDAAKLGEVLMSFARVDLKSHRIFQELSLQALAIAPTCPPLPLAAIVTAYAATHCQHVELFNVLGERALAMKEECPAVTLSAVLVAFATVGIKNDRLFIEMIPRMRHVTYYGGPQEVANILVAYTKVGLWHYKLFTRLADRAIQVRGDCRGPHLAKILGAFAKVEMKSEKLFVEMSQKVQAVAKNLTPAEVSAIGHAYAAQKVFDRNVFAELTQRAIALSSSFEKSEVDLYLAACQKAGQLTDELKKTFPDWDGSQTGGGGGGGGAESAGEQQQQAAV